MVTKDSMSRTRIQFSHAFRICMTAEFPSWLVWNICTSGNVWSYKFSYCLQFWTSRDNQFTSIRSFFVPQLPLAQMDLRRVSVHSRAGQRCIVTSCSCCHGRSLRLHVQWINLLWLLLGHCCRLSPYKELSIIAIEWAAKGITHSCDC